MPGKSAKINTANLAPGDYPFHWCCASLHDWETYRKVNFLFFKFIFVLLINKIVK